MLLSTFGHPGIVKLNQVLIKTEPILILKMYQQNLWSYIKNGCIKNVYQIQWYTFEIIKTLEYLHHNNIIHRDIKSTNILISNDRNHVIIADFGLSRLYEKNKELSSNRCSYVYGSPEVLLGENKYEYYVDIWSTAVVIIEMVINKHIFHGNDGNEVMESILSICGCPSTKEWPNLSKYSSFNYQINWNKFGKKNLSITNYLKNLNNTIINKRMNIIPFIQVMFFFLFLFFTRIGKRMRVYF